MQSGTRLVMAKIRTYDHFPKELKQSDPNGCIPTCIAAVLQSYGMRKSWITEQEVTRACLLAIPGRSDWSFENLDRLEVLSKLTPEEKEHSLEKFFVLHTRGFPNFDDWWKQVTEWVDQNGWPVLISYTRENGGPHACTVIGVNGDELEMFDPSDGPSTIPTRRHDLQKIWSSSRPRLNHDILGIEFNSG